ncbi:uncharacterized protein LOC103313954 [Tribolium castaneum]|uniref:uncharacterized protein LOC103313954 n=1 Tax=Tribolium castaneum TaxID=7070 RepID=UPI0030FE9977
MAQPPCKRTRLAISSDLETLSGISENMDVTTENRSVEVQGAGAQDLEGNRQCNSDNRKSCLIASEQFKDLLRKSYAFVDKTLFIQKFFGFDPSYDPNEELSAESMLITAPSRFGKSVIMNTLKVFCEPDVDEQGNIVTCLKKNVAGKWVEDKNKTPPKNYKLFKTVIRNKHLQIYSCTCLTKHMDDDLENGTCDSRQFFYQHCGQHPVIFFSLKDISPHNWNGFIKTLKESLCQTYKKHMYLGDQRSRLDEDMKLEFNLFLKGKKRDLDKEGQPITLKLDEEDLRYSLYNLIEYLYIQFNKTVLILIEEFDAPLMKLLHNPEENIKEAYIRKTIRYIGEMLSTVLKGNEKVLGALINACVLLSTTISPYANNVSICPFLENHGFSEYYGFTKDEVADLLKMPEFKGFNGNDILSYYNGYKVLGTNLQIYNTYSVLKYLQDWKDARERGKRETNKSPDMKKHAPRSYFSSHGIQPLNKLFAVEGLRDKFSCIITEGTVTVEKPVDKLTPEHVMILMEVMLQPSEVDDEHANLFLQYMKDRGYFNIIERNRNQHVYVIPNGEATDEILSQFYDTSYFKSKYNISNEMIRKYRTAINDLDRHNNESFQKFADSIASLFSGSFKPKNHDELKGILYAFCVNKFDTLCEGFCQENKRNRFDLLLIRKDGTGIIIEVKFGQRSAQNGLKQIFDNEYYKAFEGKNITKDKIYIGLHTNHQKVTVCGFATSYEQVVDSFANISVDKLIVKSSKL